VTDVLSAILLLLGALSCLLGALGLVRLPDLPSRLQAATKPQTLGLLLILAAAALRVELESAVTLVLVGLFQVITAPVISQLLGRSAYRSDAVRRELLVTDELADRTPGDRPS
jgi:multicomponent Na+:H+ antiporter subunit G